MKVCINRCYGGFGLSDEGLRRYNEITGYNKTYGGDVERDDPYLIHVVEELGEKSWGVCSKLEIIEIPDDVEWTIEEYDGREWVAEVHRTWC